MVLPFIIELMTLYKLESVVWKKAVHAITFYLQFLCVGGYSKHSNDTPKLNIHKYTKFILEVCGKKLFSHLVEVSGSMYFENIFQIMCMSKKCTNLERNWNNSGCIKVDNFCKSMNF